MTQPFDNQGDLRIPADLRKAIWDMIGLYAERHQLGPRPAWGLGAATYDPRATGNNNGFTAGVVQLVEVFVPETFVCSTVHLAVVVAGNTLANSFAGIYDDQGNRVAVSADQSSSWQSGGGKAIALATPVTLDGGRRYYVAFLVGSATSVPQMARGADNGATNAGTLAPFRSAVSGSGQTALPASITLGGVTANSMAWWAGLS